MLNTNLLAVLSNSLGSPWVGHIIEIGSTATAISAVAGLAVKYFIRPARKKLREQAANRSRIYSQIDIIAAEFKTNGGSSMRDQVDYIKLMIDKVHYRKLNYFQFDPHGIVEVDEHGKWIFANRAFLEIVHRDLGEVKDNGWRNLITDIDREHVTQEWERAVADQRDFYIKTQFLSRNDTYVPVEFRALAVRTLEGVFLGYLGMINRLDRRDPPADCKYCDDVDQLREEVTRLMTEKKTSEPCPTISHPA